MVFMDGVYTLFTCLIDPILFFVLFLVFCCCCFNVFNYEMMIGNSCWVA